MTHMLHRTGDPDSLSEDYPMLAIRAKGFNHEGNDWRLRKILEIAARHPIVNFSDDKTGSMFTTHVGRDPSFRQDGPPMVQMVFTDKEDMARFMEDLKEADLGISVVASGLFEEIFQCCRKAGLSPHSVHYSLGVHGPRRKASLRGDHGYRHHVRSCTGIEEPGDELVADIKQGKETGSSAAETLAKDCICGILNPVRAAKIMEAMSRL